MLIQLLFQDGHNVHTSIATRFHERGDSYPCIVIFEGVGFYLNGTYKNGKLGVYTECDTVTF